MRDIPFSEIIFRIIFPAFFATMRMLLFAVIFTGILGFFLAIFMYITRKDGLRPNKYINYILNILVSAIRSFPFIILMVSIIPLTRCIAGSSIGWKAALVPLTIAGTPFMARIFENSFKEVNPSLIEAARSFGASDIQIIFRIVVAETFPSLISGLILSIIQLLSLSAVAGTVGAGGLGASALTYGYQSFNDKVMYTIVAVLFVLVILIQIIGEFIYKKFK